MNRSALASLAALLALASCSSSSTATAPAELIPLFDQLAPEGAMELEFDRDGRFGDLEAEVPVESVPAIVRDAVAQAHPGVELTGAEREVQGGEWTWEVGFEEEGRGVQVVVSDDGDLLETERELEASEAPAEVLRAAEGAVPSSTLASVDVVTSASGDEYHVKRERDGARYKVVLTSTGEVLRIVREARAEIEIPVSTEILRRP